MPYLVVSVVALAASALTFFSGFGLGTLLLPAFALFFPVDTAVAATAAVHLANNVFKVALIGREAHFPTVLRFGLVAAAGAVAGALVLEAIAGRPPLARWTLPGGRTAEVTAVKLVVGTLLLAFAALELHPRAGRLAFPPRLLPLGGLLSGFFGGLSGHQGALRTAFLVRLGLAKEAFIATGVMCAVLIDLARLPVYAHRFRTQGLGASAGLVATAAAAAFVGSLAGRAWLPKLTTRGLRALVAVLLVLFGLALGAGIL